MSEDSPNSKLWVAGDDVKATLRHLIGNFHPDLALVLDEIAILFKDKGSKSGDVEVIGKTSKASPQLALLAERPYKFIITVSGEWWAEASDAQRIALLDHHLCACRSEEQEDGNIRYYVSPPDVGFYRDELERHGLWRTTGQAVGVDLINNIFGQSEED